MLLSLARGSASGRGLQDCVLKGFPFAPASQWDAGAALPDLFGIIWGVSPSGSGVEGRCPSSLNLVCARCGRFPTGCLNRRRAACRAANGAWREVYRRGDLGAATRRVGLSNILNSELNRRKPVEGPHGQVVGTAVVKGKLL